MPTCSTLQDYYRAYKRIAEIKAGVCLCMCHCLFAFAFSKSIVRCIGRCYELQSVVSAWIVQVLQRLVLN